MSCENLLYDDSIMMGHKPTLKEKNACCMASLQICKHRFVIFVMKINLEMRKKIVRFMMSFVFFEEISMNAVFVCSK